MFKLLPMVPPSAAPIVMPGTLRMARCNEVEPCDSISALLMTTTDCGTSIRSEAPRRLIETLLVWKSSLGREPVTVTGCMVAGAALGSAGLFSVGGGVGSGAWEFWSGGCCAIAPGAKSNPTKAVFTGTRRAISTPPRQLRPDGRQLRIIIMISWTEVRLICRWISRILAGQFPLLMYGYEGRALRPDLTAPEESPGDSAAGATGDSSGSCASRS